MQEKTRPQITGTIQTKSELADKPFRKIATVALWRQPKIGNQPTFKGQIKYLKEDEKTPNGQIETISLWEK